MEGILLILEITIFALIISNLWNVYLLLLKFLSSSKQEADSVGLI